MNMQMFHKREFTKMLMYSALLIVLPVCVVQILKFQTTQIVERLCMDNYIFMLQDASSKMDENMRELDTWAFELMVNSGVSTMLTSSSPKENSNSTYPLYKFSQSIKSYPSSMNDLCMEFQIISPKNQLVFRKNSLVSDLELYFHSMVNYHSMSYEGWKDQIFHMNQRQFWPVQTIEVDGGDVDALTYLIPIQYGTSYGQGGLISILIQGNMLKQVLDVANLEQNVEIYMFDANNTLLYSTAPGEEFSTLGYQLLSNARISEEASGFFEIDSKKMLAYSISPYNGILYAALVPEEIILQQMYTVRDTTQKVLFIYLIISIVLAVTITYKLNKPLRSLLTSIMDTVPTESKQTLHQLGEYRFVAENMMRLLQQNRSLEVSVQKNAHTLADIALDRLINGQAKPSDADLVAQHKLDFPEKWSVCTVAVLIMPELDSEYYERYPIFDLTDSIDNEKKNWNISCYAHVLSASSIALIYIMPDEIEDINQRNIEASLKRIDDVLYSTSRTHPLIGIGRQYNDLYDLHFSCDQALYSAELWQSSQDGDTLENSRPPFIKVYEREMQHLESYFYPIDLEYRIVNCVKSGEVEAMSSLLDKIVEENFKNRNLSSQMQKQLCYDIRSTLYKLCMELNVGNRFFDFAVNLDKKGNPRAYVSELTNAFRSITTEVHSSKRSHNNNLRDRVLQYVNENYWDSQLSVTAAAEKFNLSESYFSQFFKMHVGESFSSYLERLRITHAQEIIQETETIEFEKLCHEIGYGNSNTFRKAFKRFTGLSPSAYKEMCRTQKNDDRAK